MKNPVNHEIMQMASLQVAIGHWLQENKDSPFCKALFSVHEDGETQGIDLLSEDTILSPDRVAMHMAQAAYHVIEIMSHLVQIEK